MNDLLEEGNNSQHSNTEIADLIWQIPTGKELVSFCMEVLHFRWGDNLHGPPVSTKMIRVTRPQLPKRLKFLQDNPTCQPLQDCVDSNMALDLICANNRNDIAKGVNPEKKPAHKNSSSLTKPAT